MCLPAKIHRPDSILAEGEHAGYEFIINHNDLGYRCGYVRVPKGHPWHGKDHEEIEVSAHGGVNFSEPDMPCDKGGADDAWWFGFDCAHGGDAPDPDLLRGPYADPELAALFEPLRLHGTIRTQAYVIAQCRSLCEQAREAVA